MGDVKPSAWALYIRSADTEWTRYMLYDTEFRATRAMQRVMGDPLIVEIRPLYERQQDQVAEKLAVALRTIYPYVKDKRVYGRTKKPDGHILNIHIGGVIENALVEYEKIKGGSA